MFCCGFDKAREELEALRLEMKGMHLVTEVCVNCSVGCSVSFCHFLQCLRAVNF